MPHGGIRKIPSKKKHYDETQKTKEKSVTFLEGFVNVDLTSDKVPVVLHVREHAALVDPVVIMGTKEEDREVSDVMTKALDVGWNQTRVADFSRPPPAAE